MSKSDRLRLSDVRAAYRLIGDCRDLAGTPALWQGRLLEGLLTWIGATAASGGEGHWRRPGGSASAASALSAGFDAGTTERYRAYLRENGMAHDPAMKALGDIPGALVIRTREELVTDHEWYRSRLFDHYLRPSHLDHPLYSVCSVSH